jgi:hypothetical protein
LVDRFSELLAGGSFCPTTRLSIRVKQPETQHTVSDGKLRTWLDGGGKSPNEVVPGSHLYEML